MSVRAGAQLRPQTRRGPALLRALPAFAEDNLPDFHVYALVREGRKRDYTAELRWILGDQQGAFPVIPESVVGANKKREPSMPAYRFKSELAAAAEGARQAQALIDEFVTWAIEGVEDV